MSEHLTHLAEGVTRLHVETMAGDAVLRGAPDSNLIEAAVHGPSEFVRVDDALRLQGRAGRVIVPAGLAVTIEEVQGNLRLQALGGIVQVDEVHGDVRVERVLGAVTIGTAGGDIRCDAATSLTITDSCGGDLRFSAGGQLTCSDVAGDLRINDSVSASVRELGGDMWAERLSGALSVHHASGDARLSDIAGLVTLEELSGDLRGAALIGGLAASDVHGDALVHGPFAAQAEYAVTADGDVNLHLSAVDEVRLTARAAGRIRADIPLVPTADGSPTYTATIGGGTTRLTVNSGGDLRIARAGGPQAGASWERKRGKDSDPVRDLSGLGDRIREQVAASLASAGINLETGEFNMGRGRWPRGEHAGRWGTRPPTPPAPPSPPRQPKPPARSEEILTILRLVEEGKLTPEEADKLLRALGA